MFVLWFLILLSIFNVSFLKCDISLTRHFFHVTFLLPYILLMNIIDLTCTHSYTVYITYTIILCRQYFMWIPIIYSAINFQRDISSKWHLVISIFLFNPIFIQTIPNFFTLSSFLLNYSVPLKCFLSAHYRRFIHWVKMYWS